MPDLSLATEYMGVSLANPLIVASAGITETADRLRRAEDAGAGAAVMKSWFEMDIVRQSPTPRFRLLRRGVPGFRSTTLYSFEQASGFDLDRYAEEVRRAKEILDMPVFASANCVSDRGWTEFAQAMEQAGADGLELNVSCPFGPQMLGQTVVQDEMVRVTRLVKSATRVPAATKITPQLANPVAAARAIQDAGADGLVMFNRFTGLDVDVERERPIMHGGYAGHGGPWALQYVLRWISATYPQVSVPIASSGGAADGADVVKLILCGATAVETCAAVVLGGWEVIPRLLQGLTDFMESKGYASPSAFRGKVCASVIPMEEVDRRRVAVAEIDAERCTACALCERVCIYDAAQPSNEKYAVLAEACSGCGLCEQVCPARAIAMSPVTD
ncbi:MAG: 4Fe-4S binding protein [Armatimonadota bacterium]|nr:MAG: 4Fe-4S binding protein [Armatimonadota bacterium]